MAQTQLHKDILENNTLYEVEEIEGTLEYKLNQNGEKISICRIKEIEFLENPIYVFDYSLDYIKKESKYLGVNEEEQVLLDSGTIPLYSAALEPVCYLSKDVEPDKLIKKSLNKIISFATNGDGSAGRNFIIHETDFYLNADRIAIQATDKIYYMYLYFGIVNMRSIHGYNREYKAIDKNLKNDIAIQIPKEKEFNNKVYTSYELQQSIAKNIEEKLNELDKLIKYHQAMIDLKEKAIGSILDAEFSNNTNKHTVLNELIVEKSEKNVNNEIDLVYSVTNSKGIIPESENERIQTSSDDKSNYKIINKFDYAFNPSRINVGSIGMLTYEEEGVVSPIYNVFSINKTIVNPLYLSFYFKSNKFKKDVNRFVLNSVRPKLEIDDLKKFQLYFIYDENEKINKANQLKKIEELNKKIANKEKHIKLHESCIKLLQIKKEKILYIGQA